MRFYTFVLKNVIRRPVRSSLTVIGMAVAVGAVVALIGVSSGSERSFAQIYQRQNVAIVVQQRGAKQRLTSVLDAKLGDEIQKIPGVKEVNGGLVDFTSLEELGTDAVVIQGWEPGSPLMKKLEILPGGRLIEPGDSKCILLGEELARALEKKVGDKIPLFESGDFTVVGLFRSPITYETRSMVLSLSDLQKFMGRAGQVTGFAVIVDHPEDARRHHGFGSKDRCENRGRIGQHDHRDPLHPRDVVDHLGHRHHHRRGRHVEHDDHVGFRTNQGDRHFAGDRLATVAHHTNDFDRVGVAEPYRRRHRLVFSGRADAFVGQTPVGCRVDRHAHHDARGWFWNSQCSGRGFAGRSLSGLSGRTTFADGGAPP
jgi:hypothetical protein